MVLFVLYFTQVVILDCTVRSERVERAGLHFQGNKLAFKKCLTRDTSIKTLKMLLCKPRASNENI